MSGMGTGSRPTISGGGGNWFDTVTGSNDFERQSWRDAFNGGQAAGDLTGNTNARLDAERHAFGGATWTGSSTQLSALELARAMALANTQATASTGPGVAAVASGRPGATVTGPGVAAVASGAVMGPGGPRRVMGGIQLAMDSPSLLMPVHAAGGRLAMDQGWSNVADAEDRWGDTEFLSPTFFYSWGVAGADAWAMADHSNGGPLRTQAIQNDLYEAPGVVGSWLRDIGEGFLETRRAQRDPFGPDHPMPGYTTGGF